ncbi:unnamed protein product [Acanthosepion pharaonis]|uniref:Uncharacterized protein n=1 Tax=Acanthosepion pharaonis TaxID=158019 RepID=A0A812ALW7_ACAPH|nr:unnamed protein product [Sepia pharaonis]
MPAPTSDARNSEGPQTRANRPRVATNMADVRLSQTPQARRIRLDGDIQRLAAARGIAYPSSSFWSFLAFNYDPGINLTTRDNINVGSLTRVCQFCNARKWAGDPAGLCCSSGKIRLSMSKFLHLYFIAENNLQAKTWIGILPPSGRVSRRDVILLLQAMLHEFNSYIRSFKYTLEYAPFPSFRIVIDADKRLQCSCVQRSGRYYTWGARLH